MGIEWTNEKAIEGRKLALYYAKLLPWKCGFDTIDDYIQECLLSMVRLSQNYDPQKSSFGNWCYWVCRTTMYRNYKRRKRQMLNDGSITSFEQPELVSREMNQYSFEDILYSDYDNVENTIQGKLLFEYIDSLYDGTKRKNAKYVMRHWLLGERPTDIAQALGITEQRVSKIISDEKERLQVLLKPKKKYEFQR